MSSALTPEALPTELGRIVPGGAGPGQAQHGSDNTAQRTSAEARGRCELEDVKVQDVDDAARIALTPGTLPTALGKPMPSGNRTKPPSLRSISPAAAANMWVPHARHTCRPSQQSPMVNANSWATFRD